VSSIPPASNQQEKPDYLAAKLALRGLGLLDLMAILVVMAPRAAIAQVHKVCGLGILPEGPIVGYLVRSASFLYALHGAMILFVSFDPDRYLPLIRFMAWAAVLHGLAMFVIDMIEPMPFWWRCAEGLGFAATGVIVLWSLPRQGLPFTDSAS
jgi:hypothetical protein